MPKCPLRLAGFFPHQIFTTFNPDGSAELIAGTLDFHYHKPGENETYLHAEICPGEYITFIHKARRTSLLFESLCFLVLCLHQRKAL